jgi:hypothetical protein
MMRSCVRRAARGRGLHSFPASRQAHPLSMFTFPQRKHQAIFAMCRAGKPWSSTAATKHQSVRPCRQRDSPPTLCPPTSICPRYVIASGAKQSPLPRDPRLLRLLSLTLFSRQRYPVFEDKRIVGASQICGAFSVGMGQPFSHVWQGARQLYAKRPREIIERQAPPRDNWAPSGPGRAIP